MVTSPSAGDSIDATWGQSVAIATGMVTSSDVTTSSATPADFTGLSVTVTSGKNYNFTIQGTYQHSTTTGGPILEFTWTGSGNIRAFVQYAGETAADSLITEWQTTTDGGTGVATAAAANTRYFIRGQGVYQCTGSGTFKVRIARTTAGTCTFEKGFMFQITSD